MKKINIIIIIMAVVFVFSSCITKEDIEIQNNRLNDLEEDLEDAEDEYDELVLELDSLSREIEAISETKNSLAQEVDAKQQTLDEINASIEEPCIPYTWDMYHLSIVTFIYYKKWDDEYLDAFLKDYDEDASEDGFITYTYTLFGDASTDKYITLSLKSAEEFGELYSATLSYKSDSYKDDYENIAALCAGALIGLVENPYDFKTDIYRRSLTFLEEGSYFDGFYKLDREETENGGTTTIYATNIK